MTTLSAPLPSIHHQHALQALHTLEQDIHRLRESMTLLHDLVQDQQPTLDSIEDSIRHSKEQTEAAKEDLQQAEVYQASTSATNRLIALAGIIVSGIVYILL